MPGTRIRIAVSGGTGFVGGHLLPLLLEMGADVTCLVRSTSNQKSLPDGVGVAVCDFTSGEGLAAALAGQDIFIHMAALLFGLHWKAYLEANTLAAQRLCAALSDLGSEAPAKSILLSSMAATGPSKEPAEDGCMPHPVSAYGWSKLLVERTFTSQYTGKLVILRPSIIYGSGDRGLLPVFQGARYGFAFSPGFGRTFPVSCIHGHDMARAIISALADEAHGIYHVSDGNIYTMDEFNVAMCEALGHPRPLLLHVPLPIMGLSAALSSAFGSSLFFLRSCLGLAMRRAPNWNIDKYREAAQAGWVCSAKRLREELGFKPELSLRDGMQESVAGYRKRGWL